MAMWRRAGTRAHLGHALGVQAHMARGLGHADQAWECVDQALRLGVECEAVDPLLLALPAMALLLADRGEAERAVELYALACRYPAVSNSRWYEEVAGRELAAVAAALPAEVAMAAQERGRARDIWAKAQELLVELG